MSGELTLAVRRQTESQHLGPSRAQHKHHIVPLAEPDPTTPYGGPPKRMPRNETPPSSIFADAVLADCADPVLPNGQDVVIKRLY